MYTLESLYRWLGNTDLPFCMFSFFLFICRALLLFMLTFILIPFFLAEIHTHQQNNEKQINKLYYFAFASCLCRRGSEFTPCCLYSLIIRGACSCCLFIRAGGHRGRCWCAFRCMSINTVSPLSALHSWLSGADLNTSLKCKKKKKDVFCIPALLFKNCLVPL